MTVTSLTITDTISLPQSIFDANGKLPRTSDGYAVLDCPVARSGIQEYLAVEMGDAFKDRDPRSIVRVYRPDDVIFGDASLASYAHKPLTNDHPPVAVTADNWKQYAIGHTGDEVRQDGKRVRVPMLMADAGAIAAVEGGKVEWSAGYAVTFDVLPDGVAPDGTLADAIVTGQKINHIALVDRGRAGPECRIGDNERRTTPGPEQGERQMAEVKMTDGGIPFSVADATAEAVVNKIIAARDAAAKLADDRAAEIATLTKDRDTLTGEKAALEKRLEDAEVTPQKLQEMADARAKVIESAKKIAPNLVTDGKTEAEIRKAAVAARLGDAATALNDDAITGAFAAMTAGAVQTNDGIATVVSGGLTNNTDAKADYAKARETRLAELRGEKQAA